MTRENRLFLGNPGTGKSTLINCLIREPKLKSGISWGHGLTKAYHRVEHDGVAYMDTPGLADSSIAQQSASAITEALKQGGRYKLFFMMRLQNGRVVSEDVVTLERVLDAIQVDPSKIRFSVVFNMLDKAQYALLTKPGSSEFALVKRVVNGRRFKTDAFCFIPEMAALNEASDTIATLPPHVCDFMDQTARSMNINPSVVKPVDPIGFDQQAREVQEEMEWLLKEKAVMLSALASGEQRHQDAMQREAWNHRLRHDQNDAAASHSPTHNYIGSPQTPYLEQPHDGKPSASIPIRKKTLVIVALVIVVVFAASISLVATLPRSTSKETSVTNQTQLVFCTSRDKFSDDAAVLRNGSIDVLAKEAADRNVTYFAIKGISVNSTEEKDQVAFLSKEPKAEDRKECSKDPSLWFIYEVAGK